MHFTRHTSHVTHVLQRFNAAISQNKRLLGDASSWKQRAGSRVLEHDAGTGLTRHALRSQQKQVWLGGGRQEQEWRKRAVIN